MRSVATRPGTTTFTVTPSRATSRATVFDQPTREDRRALEMPRLGMGAITPEDVLVMTRPHFFARIAGRMRSVMAITDSTIDWKFSVQIAGVCPAAVVGG